MFHRRACLRQCRKHCGVAGALGRAGSLDCRRRGSGVRGRWQSRSQRRNACRWIAFGTISCAAAGTIAKFWILCGNSGRIACSNRRVFCGNGGRHAGARQLCHRCACRVARRRFRYRTRHAYGSQRPACIAPCINDVLVRVPALRAKRVATRRHRCICLQRRVSRSSGCIFGITQLAGGTTALVGISPQGNSLCSPRAQARQQCVGPGPQDPLSARQRLFLFRFADKVFCGIGYIGYCHQHRDGPRGIGEPSYRRH